VKPNSPSPELEALGEHPLRRRRPAAAAAATVVSRVNRRREGECCDMSHPVLVGVSDDKARGVG
jgi:hypothetical protein